MAQIQTGKVQKILTIFLCFLVAFFEGYDLQAPGIAAKGIAATFGYRSEGNCRNFWLKQSRNGIRI